MPRKSFLLSVFLFSCLTTFAAPQNGSISSQQVMNTLAGMRADITLLMDENKRLSLRVEAAEEELSRKNTQLKDLQTLCDALAQQNRAFEARILEIQKALENDQRQRKGEFDKLTRDLTNAIDAANGADGGADDADTVVFTVEPGDNLSSIAKAMKCTVAQIMKLNPQLKSPDSLKVGQTLRIPRRK